MLGIPSSCDAVKAIPSGDQKCPGKNPDREFPHGMDILAGCVFNEQDVTLGPVVKMSADNIDLPQRSKFAIHGHGRRSVCANYRR